MPNHLASTQLSIEEKKRIVFEIPDFIEFGELLNDRLHSVLAHLEEIEEKFTLITNIFNREPERLQRLIVQQKEDLEALTYAGTLRQRRILEEEEPRYLIKRLQAEGKEWEKAKWKKERNKNWTALRNRQLTRDLVNVDSFQFFDKFRQGALGIDAIKIGKLKDYFSTVDNILRVNEYPILTDYFDLEQDKFLGIPLLGAGLFQGIVWIIFPSALTEKLENPERVRRIMKVFQMEYDNLVMNWDVKGRNITRTSFFDQARKEVNPENEIQQYINVDRYYSRSEHYHEERIRQNDAVLERVKDEHTRTAVITILLDSYAHNISAHSLTTLSYWFRERADYGFEEGKQLIEALGRENNPLIKYSKAFAERNLSRELFRLFKFLLEKGAFWSGITRQTNFTGKVSSLYNVLWHDFANNPLYLGTIANTEEVYKLHINITIYEKEQRRKGEHFRNRKVIKKNRSGELLDGTFAIVNLEDFEGNKISQEGTSSPFVEKGVMYDALSQELRTFKAFFPGGVIGKHAFFTLLENEIRNVKHYSGESLAGIQKDGLVLNISIHERPIDSEAKVWSKELELYKIGVWLKHPANIERKLLIRRIEGLDADIVKEDTFQPKLGGNFQDKICGSVLMMSAFDQVQSTESVIGRIYYPWIKTASYLIRKDVEAFNELEVSHRKFHQVGKQFDQVFESEEGKGYLKKYFHIWRGADILDARKGVKIEDNELERKERYRFIFLAPEAIQQHQDLKSNGLIRLIEGKKLPKTIEEAYQLWLPKWLKKGHEKAVIDFKEGKTKVGRLTYEQGWVQYENETQIADADLDDSKYKSYKAIQNRMEISIEHGSRLTLASDKFNYRSHGEFITKLCEGISINKLQTMSQEAAFELFEALISKVCIFDRRIYNRFYTPHVSSSDSDSEEHQEKLALQSARLELYRQQLHLNFQTELLERFKEVKEEGFLNYHFVVIHLSFIEGLLNSEGDQYGEEGIVDFIDDYILQGTKAEEVGDNFMLIITTGRGRTAWWTKIKEKPAYTRFITFRPIESIIGAVEDALQKPDDIDLKYNLCKLFFGS